MSDLTNPIFTDEAAAIDHMENDRWPSGANCPFCGSVNVHKMAGKTQAGMWLCNDCRDKFTVRTGTVFERSHIPLHKWLLATHLMASSKKGISAHQLYRMLGFGSYRTAWFMAHRIRAAMGQTDGGKLGGPGTIVEADETELAPSRKTKGAKSRRHNRKVLSLIERDGRARSFRIDSTNVATIKPIVDKHVDKASKFMTDTGRHWTKGKMEFPDHEMVNHLKKEYARGEAHVNTAEGYFSIFKRGLVGTYQHMSTQHLHRYLDEFDFRMSNRARLGVDDAERANRILKGATGKRLTYHQPD